MAIHPDDRLSATSIKAATDASQLVTQQYRIMRPNGSIRWVEDRKKVILDDDGKVMMLGDIAKDTTFAKERDEAQRQVTSKLEQLVADRTKELERAHAAGIRMRQRPAKCTAPTPN